MHIDETAALVGETTITLDGDILRETVDNVKLTRCRAG